MNRLNNKPLVVIGVAVRSVLPVPEGMTRAGVEAGLSGNDARRVAAQVFQGTAAQVLQTDLSLDEIKVLTPMEMVDESAVSDLFLKAARAAKERVEGLQSRLLGQ